MVGAGTIVKIFANFKDKRCISAKKYQEVLVPGASLLGTKKFLWPIVVQSPGKIKPIRPMTYGAHKVRLYSTPYSVTPF